MNGVSQPLVEVSQCVNWRSSLAENGSNGWTSPFVAQALTKLMAVTWVNRRSTFGFCSRCAVHLNARALSPVLCPLPTR